MEPIDPQVSGRGHADARRACEQHIFPHRQGVGVGEHVLALFPDLRHGLAQLLDLGRACGAALRQQNYRFHCRVVPGLLHALHQVLERAGRRFRQGEQLILRHFADRTCQAEDGDDGLVRVLVIFRRRGNDDLGGGRHDHQANPDSQQLTAHVDSSSTGKWMLVTTLFGPAQARFSAIHLNVITTGVQGNRQGGRRSREGMDVSQKSRTHRGHTGVPSFSALSASSARNSLKATADRGTRTPPRVPSAPRAGT